MRTDPFVAHGGTDLRREHRQLRELTDRYVAALPVEHRHVLELMALRRGTDASQLVASLIADAVAQFQQEELRAISRRRA